MPIATGLALGLAGISAAGGLGGAALAAHGAGKQADAAKSAAQLSHEDQQASLDFQKQEWNTQQANEAPYLAAGKGALNNLQAIEAMPGQGWDKTFTPPTAEQAAQYPGYQFQLEQGKGALENSAAAKGALYSGNTQEALINYAEKAGQSDYNNVYNQAFQQYNQAYGQHNDQLNRLAAMAGVGQSATATLGQEGQAAAGNISNINLTAGAQQGQDLNNAAAAEASGYAAYGNALNSGVGGGVNNIMNLLMLQKMFPNGVNG